MLHLTALGEIAGGRRRSRLLQVQMVANIWLGTCSPALLGERSDGHTGAACGDGGWPAAVLEVHLRLVGGGCGGEGPGTRYAGTNASLFERLPDAQTRRSVSSFHLLLPSRCANRGFARFSSFFSRSSLSSSPGISVYIQPCVLSVSLPMRTSRARSLARSRSCRPMSWFIYEP